MALALLLTLLPSPFPAFEEGPEPELACRIQRLDDGAGAVEIQILIPGDLDGTTELSVSPGWGGVTDGADDLSQLRVQSAGDGGGALALTELAPHRWSVQHPPGEPLDLRYRIDVNDHQSNGDPGVHRRTIVTDTLFHGIGELFLVIPEHLNAQRRALQTLEWVGFDESEELAFSFGVGPGPHRFEASIDEFRHSVFIGGGVKLMLRDVWGSPLWIAVEEYPWGFDLEEFAELAASIVDVERSFFEDFDRPFYLISMIPVGEPQPGSFSFGGTGLRQSFSLAVQPGFDLRRQAQARNGAYEQLVGLLAHELFHDWNGVLLQRVAPEQLCYWFSEGFTEFFARRLQLRGGFIELDDYVRSLNDSLYRFYTSPVREAKNSRILDDFWTDSTISDLPYRRGDVVAMILDHALREHSEGARCLDDLMRELVERGTKGWKIGTEEFLEIVERETSTDLAEMIRSTVVDGHMPVLDVSTFAPCLGLETVEMPGYDIGFDVEVSVAEGRASGVRDGGPAFAAGLRDGDVLRSWGFQAGRADSPVELQIEGDQGARTIRFMPVGAAVAIPQFRLEDASAFEGL